MGRDFFELTFFARAAKIYAARIPLAILQGKIQTSKLCKVTLNANKRE
jgi:hypothetical protein